MELYQIRVLQERNELQDKLHRLKTFNTENKNFTKLPPLEQSLLLQQQSVMQMYLNILDNRIALFKK